MGVCVASGCLRGSFLPRGISELGSLEYLFPFSDCKNLGHELHFQKTPVLPPVSHYPLLDPYLLSPHPQAPGLLEDAEWLQDPQEHPFDRITYAALMENGVGLGPLDSYRFLELPWGLEGP